MISHDLFISQQRRSRNKYFKFYPSLQVAGDPSKSIMVRHLSPDTKESTLREIFIKCGEIVRCRLVRDLVTGKSRRYAFIEYQHRRDAKTAIHELNGALVDDQVVVVDEECQRTLDGWIPRRFGGGFGGKKESGQLRFGGIERPFRRPIPVNSKPIGGGGEGGSTKRSVSSRDHDKQNYGHDHNNSRGGREGGYNNRDKRPRR